MSFVIVIPARFFSSRFPGKLLADIHGKPVIVRVIERAMTVKPKKIIVATDSIIIKKAVDLEYFRSIYKELIEVCLTQSTHNSGMERLSEVISRYQFPNNQIIVHLQGDEPLVSSFLICKLVQSLYKMNNIYVSTLATPIRSLQEATDSNIVKVVVNINNDALYFSRSMIPWSNQDNKLINNNNMLFRHIGIYSYRASFIYRYVKWSRSPLEQLEMLEQLRILWHGETIRVSIIDDIYSVSVDTPESLKRVNELFLK